jgi:hypothetical protein
MAQGTYVISEPHVKERVALLFKHGTVLGWRVKEGNKTAAGANFGMCRTGVAACLIGLLFNPDDGSSAFFQKAGNI